MSKPETSTTSTKKARITKTVRAGLSFPVSKINNFIRDGRYTSRLAVSAPIYITSVIEYLVAEVLELAGNAARDNNKKRITPRYIQLAIRNDEELSQLLRNTTIPGAGVLPSIHSVLLPKTKGSSQKPAEKSQKTPEKSQKTAEKKK